MGVVCTIFSGRAVTTMNACNNLYYPVVLGAVLSLMFGLLSGGLLFLFTLQLSEWKNRKEHSQLGVIILAEIQEELSTGIGLMRMMQNSVTQIALTQPATIGVLPTKSWSGMKTIPDKVVLRVIATNPNKNIKLRSDCKNYFEHICGSINGLIEHRLSQSIIVSRLINVNDDSNHLVAAINLNNDIEEIKNKLLSNAKRKFPL